MIPTTRIVINRVERAVSDALALRIGASREVRTGYGIIDLMTRREIIEVKNASDWLQGMRQLLSYKFAEVAKDKTLVLYLYHHVCKSRKQKNNIINRMAPTGIKVQFHEDQADKEICKCKS